MAASKRLGALLEVERRLKLIRNLEDDGETEIAGSRFWTNAGAAVLVGEALSLGDGDPDQLIALVVGDSEESPRGDVGARLFDSRVPVSIQCYARVSTAGTGWQKVEEMLADVQRAVEDDDRSVNGFCLPEGLERVAVRAATRPEGHAFAGGSVEYVLAFENEWGAP